MNRRWRRLLSAGTLDDVPISSQPGTAEDATDREVWSFARKGQLHPGTNLGVVYRVAFASHMEPGELPLEPYGVRLGFGGTAELEAGSRRDETPQPRPMWLLATTRGLRWHYSTDGVPGFRTRRVPDRFPGPRAAGYEEIDALTIDQADVVQYGPMYVVGFIQSTGRDRFGHGFYLGRDTLNGELLEEARLRVSRVSPT